jgi:hypothetical protein
MAGPFPTDLRFRPGPSIYEDSIEGEIAKVEDEANRTEAETKRRSNLAYDPAQENFRYDEMRTALRFERDQRVTFIRANGGGADFVDSARRRWDFIGSNVTDRVFNMPDFAREFPASFQRKLENRAVDIIGVDLTGLSAGNAARIMDYIGTFPSSQQNMIRIVR